MAATVPLPELQLIPFDTNERDHLAWAADLWNEATGNALPLSQRLLQFNLKDDAGIVRGGRIALKAGRPAGFVLCSAHPGASPAMRSDALGWVEAIAVAPSFQRQGFGRALLRWAEAWLVAQETPQVSSPYAAADDDKSDPTTGPERPRHILVGGGLRPFTPGPLADSAAEGFFLACGYRYAEEPFAHDVARTLSDYMPPPLPEVSAAARPAQPGQEALLLDFLAAEFPGRWHWAAKAFLADGGRISDYMLLWTAEGVRGTCRLTFEDSAWPIERFYPYTLPRPWGQLGSIGISAHLRGQGLGLTLLDAGLRRLHNGGVNGCVIDWTTLLEFYAICGFRPFQKWAQLHLVDADRSRSRK